MLRRNDGTPYTVGGSLSAYNPQSAERALFDRWDAEAIRINGTPLHYYELFLDANNIDPDYLESRNKIWCQTYICLYGMYDPITSQNYQNMFGIDSPDEEMVFELNFSETLKILGHKPKVGSRIFTPHRGEHWVIKQIESGEWKMWKELRLRLLCDRYQESLSTGEGRVTYDDRPDPLR